MAVAEKIEFAFDVDARRVVTQSQTVNAAGDITDPRFVTDGATVQITGDATDISVRVERAARNPSDLNVNWALVDIISGNPSAGMRVQNYQEYGGAFYRFNVVSITGYARLSLATRGA